MSLWVAFVLGILVGFPLAIIVVAVLQAAKIGDE